VAREGDHDDVQSDSREHRNLTPRPAGWSPRRDRGADRLRRRAPQKALASDPNDVVLGATNYETDTTSISMSVTNGFHAFQGIATDGAGVFGSSNSSAGVRGNTSAGDGVLGYSVSGNGVYGFVDSGTGVSGYSPSGQGVYGACEDGVGVRGDSLDKGVWGHTTSGHGVHGDATSGYAGYFQGKVYTSAYHEMKEISPPTAPAADRARLFLRDSNGKTELCIRFNTGGIVRIARQP
jgi:hypothetical protein